MSSNVDREEVQALIGVPDDAEQRDVAQCDFSRPRRLSVEQLDALRETLGAARGKSEEGFSQLLGITTKLELATLAEAHADTLLEEPPSPLAMMRFRSGGQPNWIVWESLSAVRCVERLLGCKTEAREGRVLSNLEATMLQGLVDALVRPLLDSVGVEMTEVEVIQDAQAVGSWRDAKEGADPHRLSVEVAVDAPGIQSTIHLFLSGFCGQPSGDEPAEGEEIPTTVPRHVGGVTVDLQAVLAGVEVPLAQLLNLEEGDVIPIGVRAGHPVTAMIEGRPVALAEWGTQHGQMAIRVLAFDSVEEEDL